MYYPVQCSSGGWPSGWDRLLAGEERSFECVERTTEAPDRGQDVGYFSSETWYVCDIQLQDEPRWTGEILHWGERQRPLPDDLRKTFQGSVFSFFASYCYSKSFVICSFRFWFGYLFFCFKKCRHSKKLKDVGISFEKTRGQLECAASVGLWSRWSLVRWVEVHAVVWKKQ